MVTGYERQYYDNVTQIRHELKEIKMLLKQLVMEKKNNV
jgi:hypothetical protein